MKDFLEGRTNSPSTRAAQPVSTSDSKLPPIPRPEPQPLPEEPQAEPTDPPADPPPLDEPPADTSPPDDPTPQPPQPSEPTVELLHDDQGRIDHIIVTASNGERIILKCDY